MRNSGDGDGEGDVGYAFGSMVGSRMSEYGSIERFEASPWIALSTYSVQRCDMDHMSSEAAARGSAELWIEAAFQALLDGGVDAVKILPLAKKLKLSRTSFYWFFDDREKLLAALITRWRDKNTGAIVRQSAAYAETIVEAMLNVCDCWLNPQLFDARFEFAMRSWALQSAEVLGEVRMGDKCRIEAITSMLVRFGQEPEAAEVHARATYLTQIGYISMQTQEDIALRMKRIPKYVEIFTGEAPQARELDRFYARHGFMP